MSIKEAAKKQFGQLPGVQGFGGDQYRLIIYVDDTVKEDLFPEIFLGATVILQPVGQGVVPQK